MTRATTSRLEARISTDLHVLLKKAANLQGRSMTDFVISAARDAAIEAIQQAEIISLSAKDQYAFAEAMLAPVKHSKALASAFVKRNELLRSE